MTIFKPLSRTPRSFLANLGCALLGLSLLMLITPAANGWQQHASHEHAEPANTTHAEHMHSNEATGIAELNVANAEPELSQQQTPAMTQYVCPMHPEIVRGEPGTCPICGMDLVAREASQSERPQVNVSGDIQQALGIRTEHVMPRTLWRYIDTQGQVVWNTNAQLHVHPRAAGWLEQLSVRTEGERVEAGEVLYEIYSQAMVVAQQDYLQTLGALSDITSNARRQALREDGRTRLRLLGFAPKLIEELEQTQRVRYEVPIYAPQSGVVTSLNVSQGMFVEPNSVIMTITGDDGLWLIGDVPQAQADWFNLNSPVEVTLAAADLNEVETSIDYIYPELDAMARTLRVRVKLPELAQAANAKLLVGQQARLEIFGGPQREVLAVPVAALIQAPHEQVQNRVILQQDDGTFVQQAVEVGLIAQDYAEILSGLAMHQQVVVSGQFLLDAEASLNAIPPAQEAQNAHAHH